MGHLDKALGGLLLLLCYGAAQALEEPPKRPHILLILADDMGVDDISFRGSNKFLTPNIDALAYSGVILKNLYTPAMCTPSRAALLTGKYPIHTGMQHYVIPNDHPGGLPLNETTMAEIFKANGYYTSIFGKWHLGMSRKAYTPTLRGFDHHFGYLGAFVDYYKQTLDCGPEKNYSVGHDFRKNLAVSREHVGVYVPELLTDAAVELIHSHNTSQQPLFLLMSQLAPHAGNDDDPLQAPAEEVAKFSYMKDPNRRIYAAMMSILDKCVGRLIDALAEKDILDNTIIVFLSDNGGPTQGMHSTTASNYPLRGQKNSPWEGGIRSSGAIWSTKIEKLSTVWQQKFYIADLLPTLAAAADITLDPELSLDGLNLWSALKYGYQSVEREIVHNIDNIFNYVSYSQGKWKYVRGTTENGTYDGWLGVSDKIADEIDPRAGQYEEVIRNTSVWSHMEIHAIEQSDIPNLRKQAAIKCLFETSEKGIPCEPLKEPCFFDIDEDPCEQNNLYKKYGNSKLMHLLMERLDHLNKTAKLPNNSPTDPRCDPKLHNYEWTWWEDAEEKEEQEDNGAAGLGDRWSTMTVISCVALVLGISRVILNC